MTQIFTRTKAFLATFIVVAALSLCGFATQAHAEPSASQADQDAATTQTRAAKPVNKPTKAGWMKDTDGTWYYFSSVNAAPKTGWLKTGGKWYYLDPSANGALLTGYFTVGNAKYIANGSGALYTNRWVHYKGNVMGTTMDQWFYATKSGALKTGWFKSSGKWYYLEPKYGLMATDQWTDDGYRLTVSGEMATGWVKELDDWYLFNSAGKKTTGWQKRGGKWYYLDPAKNGAMKTGNFRVNNAYYITNSSGAMYANRWVKYDNEWYYATKSGAMKIGWLKSGGKWYWMQPNSGPMATGGWINDGKYDYYINKSGVMATGWVKPDKEWYYLNKSGTKTYGWVKSGGKWYYLDKNKNGTMAKSETLFLDGKYYSFNADGSMK